MNSKEIYQVLLLAFLLSGYVYTCLSQFRQLVHLSGPSGFSRRRVNLIRFLFLAWTGLSAVTAVLVMTSFPFEVYRTAAGFWIMGCLGVALSLSCLGASTEVRQHSYFAPFLVAHSAVSLAIVVVFVLYQRVATVPDWAPGISVVLLSLPLLIIAIFRLTRQVYYAIVSKSK